DSLPPTHPMNDPKIFTSLEIVLTREGQIVKMGVVKTSGITAFDIAALDSVQRASPFGPAPGAIISPDGNVYLHWEFHRDEMYACSTMNARPIMLKTAPNGPTPAPNLPIPPVTPNPSQERGMPTVNVQDTREGNLISPVSADSRG
ncbi:MAG: TonB family protein, partial [Polyangiaceae bacterium]